MIAVKLGGAVITHKEHERRFRTRVTRRLARELAAADGPLVIVHGAGSFGHPQAMRYQLHRGWVPEIDQREGIAVTHAVVRELNLRVMRELRTAGIACTAVPPFPVLNEGYLHHLREVLDLGLTPVTFGDVLIDGQPSIVSGDYLMQLLASRLPVQRVIFVTNVDGIYARPYDPATLIGECTPAELERALVGDSTASDVTAGMAGKVKSIKEMVYSGAEVAVINGNKPGRLRSALCGTVTGTRVVQP
ncbi:MAG: isopentenyl phosphate kinase [Thermoplasmatota archaeon]